MADPDAPPATPSTRGTPAWHDSGVEYEQVRRPDAVRLAWSGTVVGVQPRILLTRSFDQCHHSYLGYVLRIDGQAADAHCEFMVAIGKAAQAKHALQAGDAVRGLGVQVHASPREIADIHRVSQLVVLRRAATASASPPPWLGVPPPLEVYRARGHRRLASATFNARCPSCLWGCEMPVEMIIDQWNPSKRRYRRETFCYGPKSCTLYAAGPTRNVPGRKGKSWEEEDWVAADSTSHRSDDE